VNAPKVEPDALGRCQCEHADCSLHEAGACQTDAFVIAEFYGIKQALCGACLSRSVASEA
jgi:hypothetical protein